MFRIAGEILPTEVARMPCSRRGTDQTRRGCSNERFTAEPPATEPNSATRGSPGGGEAHALLLTTTRRREPGISLRRLSARDLVAQNLQRLRVARGQGDSEARRTRGQGVAYIQIEGIGPRSLDHARLPDFLLRAAISPGKMTI
jgi:hypothetical protein